MNGTRHGLSLILLVSLSLLISAVRGQDVVSRQVAPSMDESELRRLAARYATALAGNDQQALAAIVSSPVFQSGAQPDFAERNDAWQSVMALSTRVELRDFNIKRVVIGSAPEDDWRSASGESRRKSEAASAKRNRATVFLSISIRAFSARTGRARHELLNMHRVLKCAKLDPGYRVDKEKIKRTFPVISYQKESHVWLIVSDEPDLNQLSKSVLAAKPEGDARAYLELESAQSLQSLIPEVIGQAAAYFRQEDYERGLHALRVSQSIGREIESKEKHTEILKEKKKAANLSERIEDYKKSLTEKREELIKLETLPVEKQSQAIKHTKAFRANDIVSSLSQLARSYSDGGQVGEALKYYDESLKEYEKLGNKRMMADVLAEMGEIYLKQKDEAQALEYWLQSYRLGSEGQDAKDAAIAAGEISSYDSGYYFEYEDGLPSKAVGQFATAFTGFYGRDDLAHTLDSIGEFYLKQKNYEQALVFYRKSADQYKLMAAQSNEERKKQARDAAANPESKRQAAGNVAGYNLYSDHLWRGMLASEVKQIADVYKAQGQYDKAVEYYEQAAEEMKLMGQRDEAIELYLSMGLLGNEYAQPGQSEKAVALYERSLIRLKELNAKSEVGMLYLMLAQFYQERNDHVQATAAVEKGLAAFLPLSEKSDEDDELLVGQLYLIRAVIFESQGNYAAAMQEFQKARVVPYRSESYKGMRLIFDMMAGAIYTAQGSEAVGMEMIRRLLPLETLLEGNRGLPHMLNMVGAHYEMEGNRLLSERCFHDALKFAEEAGDKKEAASALGYLGDIYSERQEYARALLYLNRKRQLVEKLPEQKEHARTLARLGDLYREQKFYVPAMEHYQRGQKIVEAIGDASFSGYLNKIAEVHHLLGEDVKALEVAERSRDVAQRAGERETLWQARSIAGQAHLALNQQREAFQALDEAISSIEFIRLHLVGDEQNRQLFLENKIAPYHAMIELLIRQNRAADALYYAERSKARELLDVMQFGRLNLEAELTREEQAKNVQLLNRLTTLNVQLRQEQQRKPGDQLKLKRLSRDIQRARLAYETFQADIYTQHPQLQDLPAGTVPLLAHEAATLLPASDGALLEFVVTPARTYLFVLTSEISAKEPTHITAGDAATAPSRTGWKVYPIDITEDELAGHVRRYLSAIAPTNYNQRSDDFKAQAGRLYDLLLKPAQAQLRGKSALVVVPDGVLWNLPFQALQTPARLFLIEDSAISYAPSLSVLREMRRLRDARGLLKASESAAPLPGANAGGDTRQPSLLLAFGDPELGARPSGNSPFARRNRLEPLPETATEVRSAVNLYGAERGRYLIGPDATEENFKRFAGDYKMLHLATHGLVNDKQPMYSQIVLSQPQRVVPTEASPTEDGYLEAREIMRLKLNADLVVLSACETALGRVGNGEGMIGLTWSLSAAGTPTIVASQWAVNSCSTTELMVGFHRQLKERMVGNEAGVGPAEALQRAALQFLHPNTAPRQNPAGTEGARCRLSAGDKQHPYFWAGFIVIGDGR